MAEACKIVVKYYSLRKTSFAKYIMATNELFKKGSHRKMTEKSANKMYNNILKKIVTPLVGDKSTFQHDLEKAGRKLLGTEFKGVYPSDKIPVLNDLKKYAIINLDKSTEPGSHWVAIAHQNQKIYVYDSFGRKTVKILPALFQSGNGSKILDTEPDPEQKIDETNCGGRSLSWLIFFEHYGSKNALLI